MLLDPCLDWFRAVSSPVRDLTIESRSYRNLNPRSPALGGRIRPTSLRGPLNIRLGLYCLGLAGSTFWPLLIACIRKWGRGDVNKYTPLAW